MRTYNQKVALLPSSDISFDNLNGRMTIRSSSRLNAWEFNKTAVTPHQQLIILLRQSNLFLQTDPMVRSSSYLVSYHCSTLYHGSAPDANRSSVIDHFRLVISHSLKVKELMRTRRMTHLELI
jgi:hypothetical protein